MLFLFDLDGTMIDSSHRQNTLADGSLDLDNWIANNTPEKIMADTLLPLANEWKAIDRNRHSIVILTARVIGNTDIQFLRENGLGYDYIYSRKEGDNSPDDILKRRFLYSLARRMNWSMARMRAHTYMFDDNKRVRDMMESESIRAFDPEPINNFSLGEL